MRNTKRFLSGNILESQNANDFLTSDFGGTFQYATRNNSARACGGFDLAIKVIYGPSQAYFAQNLSLLTRCGILIGHASSILPARVYAQNQYYKMTKIQLQHLPQDLLNREW